MFIVHCSCSLFIVPTVLLSSLMIFFIEGLLDTIIFNIHLLTTKEDTVENTPVDVIPDGCINIVKLLMLSSGQEKGEVGQ